MKRVAAIKTHRLPEAAFTALAAGEGDPAVIRLLREAQRSKHTMLLAAIAEAAGDADPADPEAVAFRARPTSCSPGPRQQSPVHTRG